MKNLKQESWIGVVGNLAVVVGLVVVAIELRQNAIVANGELSSLFQANWQEMDRSRQDPSFANVYAKSIERPAELSLAEKVQLDGYYWTAMDQLDLAQDLVESGLFKSPYEEIVRSNIRYIFSTPYARAWWESYKELSDPITVSIVDDELQRFPATTARDFFDSIEPASSE